MARGNEAWCASGGISSGHWQRGWRLCESYVNIRLVGGSSIYWWFLHAFQPYLGCLVELTSIFSTSDVLHISGTGDPSNLADQWNKDGNDLGSVIDSHKNDENKRSAPTNTNKWVSPETTIEGVPNYESNESFAALEENRVGTRMSIKTDANVFLNIYLTQTDIHTYIYIYPSLSLSLSLCLTCFKQQRVGLIHQKGDKSGPGGPGACRKEVRRSGKNAGWGMEYQQMLLENGYYVHIKW